MSGARPRTAVADGQARVESEIELVQPTGSRSYATFRLAGQPAIAELQTQDVSRAGERIRVRHQFASRGPVRCRYGKGFARMSAMTDANESVEPSRAVKLCGTEEIDPPSRKLAAGPLTVELENGQLRYVALRRRRGASRHSLSGSRRELGNIHAADQRSVGQGRSRTASPSSTERSAPTPSSGLSTRRASPGRATARSPSTPLRRRETDFVTNRTGFVVLHPPGSPGRGSRSRMSTVARRRPAFPSGSVRSQPVFDIRALSHEVGAWTVGDLPHGRRRVRDGGPAQLDRRLIQDLRAASRVALGIHARQREPARAVRALVVHGTRRRRRRADTRRSRSRSNWVETFRFGCPNSASRCRTMRSKRRPPPLTPCVR